MMPRLLLACLICSTLLAREVPVRSFPQIDQRTIAGAENRCGTIALGSWLLWLAENDSPTLLAESPPNAPTPFTNADISTTARNTLSHIDQLCGGSDEIKLLRLVEGLIEYLHQLPDESYQTVIHY